MSKVLVTGAGGFIGSHLTELLVGKGFDVRAFVRYNSRNSWGWLENSAVLGEIEVVTGDIRDFDSVKKALDSCSCVYHLAALIGIPYSYESPVAYLKTNIEGTYNVLQAAREADLENVVITSTSETYGTAQYVPIDEQHPAVGQSPYSATKISADQLALSYYKSFDLPIKIVRPFNTYGPRQSARAIIPTVISQILSGAKKIKLGNLHPTRDLTFVKDTVTAFHAIAESDSLFGEATNIGMGNEISMKSLVELIGRIMETDIIVESDRQRIRPDKSEVERLFCDNGKLVANTDWRPRYNLEQGLRETVDWLAGELSLYKPDIYNA